METGYEFYLEMVMFPQEIVMAAWLIIKGFNQAAVKELDETHESLIQFSLSSR
jgi:hypothetical protein